MSVYLLGIHQVGDYSIWRKVFDSRIDARKAAGCLGGTTYRSNEGDIQRVIALLEWDSRPNLEKFLERVKKEPFQKVLREATVIGNPEMYTLEYPQPTP